MNSRNPFDYVGANDLPGETILDYYIEDFNFSRFIHSTRNVLLVGERGCGKSMTLLYNSFPIQHLRAERENQELPLDTIGVYVPCNTPLTHKREFQLLDDFRASVISEHHFALAIAYGVAKTLSEVPNLLTSAEEDNVWSQIEFLFDAEMPRTERPFIALMQLIERECIKAQRAANARSSTNVFYENTFSFPSLIVPLLRLVRSTSRLTNTHFAFLIDDAHDLNEHQRRALFSWIAFREHSLFSFKVAIANVSRSSLATASGGSILEGHDYTRIDMVQPFHNDEADFGHLAHLLVMRRLEKCGIDSTPHAFFPVSSQMLEQLRRAEEEVRSEAVAKYGSDSGRVSDYVYKYKRAHFFRNRPATANRPEYSGFDTLVYLSTGVIRNLLMPCYWMFDKVISHSAIDPEPGTHEEPTGTSLPNEIPPNIQSEVILARSRSLWDWVRNELDKSLEGCSRENARRAYQLLDNLAVLFRERLLKHKSEPRANSFTISQQSDSVMANLNQVIDTLVAAQLLYVRSGAAKDKGKRENYYVPNRMLWPDRGLDPHGQHARVSIRAPDLWAAAEQNRPIPFKDDDEAASKQPRLFDEI
ncbi:MAG: hypothetical protein RIC55_27500 [Pirellulaceae bacterium]